MLLCKTLIESEFNLMSLNQMVKLNLQTASEIKEVTKKKIKESRENFITNKD